ncbi:MAG: hypothetical protein GY834_02840 [Bacteroidetes bacterium]|nr:hypothetical protein [Bacteroidota bacterium]
MKRAFMILIWTFTYGLTGADLFHLFIEYWANTEIVFLILVYVFIVLVELLVFFYDKMLHVVSLKQRRLLQFGIHLTLVGHTLVLTVVHHKSVPTIVFTTIVALMYFFIVHPWVHKMQNERNEKRYLQNEAK